MTAADREALLALYVAQVEMARADRALSQAKLARLADTDPATVNKFLAHADIRVSTFIRICRAAGLKVTLQPRNCESPADASQ